MQRSFSPSSSLVEPRVPANPKRKQASCAHLHHILAVLHNAPELRLLLLVAQLPGAGSAGGAAGRRMSGNLGCTPHLIACCDSGSEPLIVRGHAGSLFQRCPKKLLTNSSTRRPSPCPPPPPQTTAPQRWPRSAQTLPACSRRHPGRQRPQTLQGRKGRRATARAG